MKVSIDNNFLKSIYCVVLEQYWAMFMFNEEKKVEQDDERANNDEYNDGQARVKRFSHFSLNFSAGDRWRLSGNSP